MRKVVMGLAVSLDGFIEGPNGEYDWCFTDQDYGLSAFMKRIDAIFMGRKTWDLARSMGQESPWKGITTYVYSNTLTSVNEKTTKLVRGDVVAETRKIKEAQGKDIWLFGGAELIATFINEQLVDELWLSVHPVLLGGGKPLFQAISGRKLLRLKEVKEFGTGLLSLTYTLS